MNMLIFNQLSTYLYLAVVLFAIGLYGVLARRNLIAILISVELILNAASINFMAFNRFLAPAPAVGQIITLFIMAVAAAEAAIALSIIIAVYRKLKTVNVEQATELRG
jgi:NADH:ubiquinone oxidoreductase subunit K